MARERPLLGFGPGTFGAEYVPHRLSAEIRAKRRFVSPLLSSSYGEAHNDYLQAASDAGIPVASARAGRRGLPARRHRPSRVEAGRSRDRAAVRSSRRGRGRRTHVVSPSAPDHRGASPVGGGTGLETRRRRGLERGCCVKTGLSIAAAVLLAGLAAPELPRYSAERRVGRATAAFQESLDAPRGAETSRRILAAGELALAATSALPGDPRPWMVAASSNLLDRPAGARARVLSGGLRHGRAVRDRPQPRPSLRRVGPPGRRRRGVPEGGLDQPGAPRRAAGDAASSPPGADRAPFGERSRRVGWRRPAAASGGRAEVDGPTTRSRKIRLE